MPQLKVSDVAAVMCGVSTNDGGQVVGIRNDNSASTGRWKISVFRTDGTRAALTTLPFDTFPQALAWFVMNTTKRYETKEVQNV